MINKIRKVQKFYDDGSMRYLKERYHGTSCEHASYLIRKNIVLEYLKNSQGSILDAGCGPAIFTRELVEMGLKPYSVDLSLKMLKKARSLAAFDHETFWSNCEIEQLPFKDKTFDNVMVVGVIAYVSDTIKAINELVRVLRPGGLFIVQCSNTLAPTPNIVEVKDRIYFSFGFQPKRCNFSLINHPFSRFRKFLKRAGLDIEEKRCYDFRLPFVEKVFPGIAVDIMKAMQKNLENSKIFGWLGEGYVIKARKIF